MAATCCAHRFVGRVNDGTAPIRNCKHTGLQRGTDQFWNRRRTRLLVKNPAKACWIKSGTIKLGSADQEGAWKSLAGEK